MDVRIQSAPIDITAETARFAEGRTDAGAVVAFTGLCRDEGGRLAALHIEHYPGMAEAEIERIAGEARARWAILDLAVVHRYGRVLPGEVIVHVMVAAAHRTEAFETAGYLMDHLKTNAPFWKKEEGPDGGWVEAKAADDTAARRWRDSTP